uniref:SP-RING-type domain-containing protein n=1 Tax=Panagrolaimus sp. PS1159 TaxID=55785 RepID=A0AC35GXX9_9BILA
MLLIYIDCKNVTIQSNSFVASCCVPPSLGDLATVIFNNGNTFETTLLIGADGYKSSVRAAMGVHYNQWDYEQMAIVATLNLSPYGTNSIAWQKFATLGPIALLPLTSDLSSLVWTTSQDEARRLMGLTPDVFIDELNHYLHTDIFQDSFTNQTWFCLNKVKQAFPIFGPKSLEHDDKQLLIIVSLQTDNLAAFPLGFGNADRYFRSRAALIGDAAHRIHPLAGQGVNLGWSDMYQPGGHYQQGALQQIFELTNVLQTGLQHHPVTTEESKKSLLDTMTELDKISKEFAIMEQVESRFHATLQEDINEARATRNMEKLLIPVPDSFQALRAEVGANQNQLQSYQHIKKSIKNIKKIIKEGKETAAGNAESEEEEIVCGEAVNRMKDPITKGQITEPVRNIHCQHVYNKTSIIAYIADNRERRTLCQCPQPGCSNKRPLVETDIEDYQAYFDTAVLER